MILLFILRFTVQEVLPIQSKKVIAFLQAKIHLKPGYLIQGREGGRWHPKKILMKRGSSYYTGAIPQIPNRIRPRPIKNEQILIEFQEL